MLRLRFVSRLFFSLAALAAVHDRSARGQDLADDAINTNVRCIQFSPDGKLLVAVTGEPDHPGLIVAWNVAVQSVAWRQVEPAGVPSLSFHPQGNVLAIGSYSPVLKLIDLETKQTLREINAHADYVRCVAFSPDGETLASGGYDRAIKLWNWQQGEVQATLDGHADAVYHVRYSQDGKRLLSSGAKEQAVLLWDVAERKKLHAFAGFESLVPQAAFSPDDGKIVISCWMGGPQIYDAQTFEVVDSFRRSAGIHWCEFSPDGRRLAIATSGLPIFVVEMHPAADAATEARVAELIKKFEDDSYPVREASTAELITLGFAARGPLQAAMKSEIPEVRVRTRRLVERLGDLQNSQRLVGHMAEPNCLAFSPDGSLLATADASGAVIVWNAADGTRLATLTCGAVSEGE